MSETQITVGQETKITLHFALALAGGEQIDSNFDGQPATFTYGDGSLLPGFEEPLIGLAAGSEATFTIPPEKAFGQHNESNVQSVARGNFDGEVLEEGMVFSFMNGDGELPGVVLDIGDDEVLVDFNHPLAGQTITFTVKIVAVETAVVH